jgi:two-component system, NarL family, sensor histidine kinase BarA
LKLTIQTKFALMMLLLAIIPSLVMWVAVNRSLDAYSALFTEYIETAQSQIEGLELADGENATQFLADIYSAIPKESSELLWRLAMINMAVFLALFGVILLAAKRASRQLTDPLVDLVSAMTGYEDGKDLEVKVHTSDEIGILAQRFALMAGKISDLSAQLKAPVDTDGEVDAPPDEEAQTQKTGLEYKTGMEKALAQVKELDKNADEFLLLIRHELKTPLTSIIASSEALSSDIPFDQEGRDNFARIIQEEAQRLKRLINDVMNLSSFKTGRIPLRIEPVNLERVVQQVLGAYGQLAKAGHVQMDMIDLPNDSRLFEIRTDSDRFKQVLMNIVGNAVKFTPKGGSVTVRVDTIKKSFKGREKSFARIAVSDTGPGIDPKQRKLVFEKFQQLDNAREKGGLGLGMSIAKTLIDELGGKIWFAAKPGEGATFYVTLRIPNIRQ